MKKEYESPKAEKVEFDYEEVVVASNQCRTGASIRMLAMDAIPLIVNGKLM